MMTVVNIVARTFKSSSDTSYSRRSGESTLRFGRRGPTFPGAKGDKIGQVDEVREIQMTPGGDVLDVPSPPYPVVDLFRAKSHDEEMV
jgi:hypothetical protein